MQSEQQGRPVVTTPDVVDRVLNDLRGVDLAVACEGVTVALCELSRALNHGQVHPATTDIIKNVIAFFERFPDTTISGLTVEHAPSGPVN